MTYLYSAMVASFLDINPFFFFCEKISGSMNSIEETRLTGITPNTNGVGFCSFYTVQYLLSF